MERPPRRPIGYALLLSLVLHTLTMGTLVQWFPARGPAGEAITSSVLAVSLTDSQQTTVANTAGPGFEARESPQPEQPQLLPDFPKTHLPEPPALAPMPTAELSLDVPLDTAPVLQEEYEISMADLAIQMPIDANQQAVLATALNSWQKKLPKWQDQAELLEWQDGGQQYLVSLQRIPAGSPTELERAVLNVSTQVGGLQLSTQMAFKRIPFSHYAQVVDRWNPDVSLSSDRIDGRFHSNSELVVNRSDEPGPRVSGLATIASGVRFEGRARRAKVFLGGLETYARRIPLPRSPSPWADSSGQAANVHFIDEDARIVFEASGHYRWQALTGAVEEQQVELPESPWFIIARKGVTLRVSGKLRGSVVVYSPERISVTGNLTYVRDPQEIPDSPDYLGLVSDKSVEVASPELTGAGDLNIHAAIYAQRRFRVRGFRTRNHALLDIYGSVTAGTFSATEPRYATRVRYDPRLENKRPPNFPMTDNYELEEWDPRWTVVSAH